MDEDRVRMSAGSDADLDGAVLAAARELCDRAFDGEFTDHDWEHTVGGRRWVIVEGAAVVGHAALVGRTVWVGDQQMRAGYVEGVAVEPGRQGRGIGTLLMRAVNEAIELDHDLGLLSTGHHRFYERLGWRRWRGATFVLDAAHRRRTPDEDAGIMALPTRTTPLPDPTSSITCEARDGDDW